MEAALTIISIWSDYYSIAPTGQLAAQAPHSTQSSPISYLPSTSEIAPTGQVAAQVPQPTQVSLSIFNAI